MKVYSSRIVTQALLICQYPFGPAKVRAMLEQSGIVLMDKEWYSDLCESYTHIKPQTRPNNYNEDKRNICGGIVQPIGVEKTVDQLGTVVSMIALFYCRYFELDDYFELIIKEAGIES